MANAHFFPLLAARNFFSQAARDAIIVRLRTRRRCCVEARLAIGHQCCRSEAKSHSPPAENIYFPISPFQVVPLQRNHRCDRELSPSYGLLFRLPGIFDDQEPQLFRRASWGFTGFKGFQALQWSTLSIDGRAPETVTAPSIGARNILL